jgi:putative sigma-54 modulation protein
MQVSVCAKHVEITDEVRAYVNAKVGRLDRFLAGMERAQVRFIEERNPRIAAKEVCEVTMEGHGYHVRAKASSTDPMSAVDLVVEKLEHQLHRLKTKVVGKHNGKLHKPVDVVHTVGISDLVVKERIGAPQSSNVALADPLTSFEERVLVDEEAERQHVKTKRFHLVAMTIEQATIQMELVDHDWFFFVNSSTGQHSVLYVRDDGDVGLIESA